MLDYDWENSVGFWICAASHSMRKLLGARLNKVGITLRQWEVLAWLSTQSSGSGSQGEIADQLGIEPHTLVGILNRMEENHLISRNSSPVDRRKKIIRATKESEEVWNQTAEIMHEIRKQALIGFTEEDIDRFRTLCAKIRENVEKSSSETSGANSLIS